MMEERKEKTVEAVGSYFKTNESKYDIQVGNDILEGKVSICDIPFEYRSLSYYRNAYGRCLDRRKWDCEDIEKETIFLENQIIVDIKECEDRYQKDGNLSMKYPWPLLNARIYCLKKLYIEGVREGIFKQKKISFLPTDDINVNDFKEENYKDVLSNREYYMKEMDGYWTQAERDMLDGKIKIYDVPFEYRSRSLYIIAYRFIQGYFPKNILVEKRLFIKQILEDVEECRLRFRENGDLSEEYPCPVLKTRELLLKDFFLDHAFVELTRK